MDREELKKDLADGLCEFCPWTNGEISHRCDSVCDDALDNFLDENESYFDETENE